ncbi:MAG: hypothetical protein F6K32_09045 [Desertifilum sp. SIO1I2]|nr:hypothetical protein [Desertifilum sp. SIO1I2]
MTDKNDSWLRRSTQHNPSCLDYSRAIADSFWGVAALSITLGIVILQYLHRLLRQHKTLISQEKN